MKKNLKVVFSLVITVTMVLSLLTSAYAQTIYTNFNAQKYANTWESQNLGVSRIDYMIKNGMLKMKNMTTGITGAEWTRDYTNSVDVTGGGLFDFSFNMTLVSNFAQDSWRPYFVFQNVSSSGVVTEIAKIYLAQWAGNVKATSDVLGATQVVVSAKLAEDTTIDHSAVLVKDVPNKVDFKIEYPSKRIKVYTNKYIGSKNADLRGMVTTALLADSSSNLDYGVPFASDLPINRIVFKKDFFHTTTNDGVDLDNLNMTYKPTTGTDTVLFNDTFDDSTKNIPEDYGYLLKSNVYTISGTSTYSRNYLTENGERGMVWLPTSSSNWREFSLDLPAISSGKAVVELDLNFYIKDANGNLNAYYPYDNGKATSLGNGGFIQLRNGSVDRVLQLGASNGYGYISSYYLDESSVVQKEQASYYIGDNSNRALFAGGENKFQIVADLDNGVYDLYKKDYNRTGATSYFWLNGDPRLGRASIPLKMMKNTSGTYAFNKLYINLQYENKYLKTQVKNLNVYTLSETGKKATQPVFMSTSGSQITNVSANQVFDVYTATSTATGNDATVVLATYDDNGYFIDFLKQQQVVTDIKPSGSDLMKIRYTVPADFKASYKIKAFVWDNLDNMMPYVTSAEVSVQ